MYFYFDPIIILDVQGGLFVSRLSDRIFEARDHVSQKKIVLKTKSIVMRTTNNVFRKVHNCTHFRW